MLNDLDSSEQPRLLYTYWNDKGLHIARCVYDTRPGCYFDEKVRYTGLGFLDSAATLGNLKYMQNLMRHAKMEEASVYSVALDSANTIGLQLDKMYVDGNLKRHDQYGPTQDSAINKIVQHFPQWSYEEFKEDLSSIIASYQSWRPPYEENSEIISVYSVKFANYLKACQLFNVSPDPSNQRGWHGIKYDITNGKRHLKIPNDPSNYTIPDLPANSFVLSVMSYIDSNGEELNNYDVHFNATVLQTKRWLKNYPSLSYPVPESETKVPWLFSLSFSYDSNESVSIINNLKGYCSGWN